MKSTGITGKFDNLGRTVIPIELRRKLGNEFEIFAQDDSVVLKRIVNECEFCASTEELISFNGKYVCSQCILKLKEL